MERIIAEWIAIFICWWLLSLIPRDERSDAWREAERKRRTR